MARLLDLYCTLLKGTIAAFLAVMVVLVFGNVVLRYGFNSGIAISEELSRWLLVWLTFLGAVVAMREHAHLGVDAIVRMLPAVGKRFCFIINYCLMLFADWLLLSGSWRQTIINIDDRAPATRPVAWHLLWRRRDLRRFGRSDPSLRPVPCHLRTGQRSRHGCRQGIGGALMLSPRIVPPGAHILKITGITP
ncbi:TRAP-type C4-dicarboxylate transport system permease small subunit [Bradyrhizobium sp. F1.13.4]